MPKEVIDLSRDARRRTHTFMIYGKSRTGKTRFLGTFPRPLVIADKPERGWETFRYMPDEALYEPGRPPVVWSVTTPQEMTEALQDAEAEIRQDPDRYGTLGVDSLGFYADGYFAGLEVAALGGNRLPDYRKLYQSLATHLRYIMLRAHELPTNIVWTCLDKEPGEGDGGTGGILLPGQTASKAPALCNYWLYLRSFQAGTELTYEIRTRRWGAFPAGGRDGGLLPDPITDARYKVIEEALGLQPAFRDEVQAPPASRRAVPMTRR